jgi:hypothetical protein
MLGIPEISVSTRFKVMVNLMVGWFGVVLINLWGITCCRWSYLSWSTAMNYHRQAILSLRLKLGSYLD